MSPATPALRADRSSSSEATATMAFASAADGWFWYVACHRARVDGARMVAGMAAVRRPCEPGDIHRIVTRLYRIGHLRPQHLEVPVRYGRTMMPPDSARADRSRDLADWQTALACLDRALRARQIVA